MGARLGWVALAALGCTGPRGAAGPDASSTPTTPHPPLSLPATLATPSEVPPDALVHHDGRPVADPDDWRLHRRPDLLELFAHHVYGGSAVTADASGNEVVRTSVDGGTRIELEGQVEGLTLAIALWVPAGEGPFPVILGLNKCGNASVTLEPVLDGGGWQQDDCEGPGSRASYWDASQALAAGVGVATLHQSDIHPDDATYDDGVRRFATPDHHDPWGAIGAWAWGLSRAVDLLVEVPEVDAERIVAFGHSRRGKTALWAAAQDERIGGVWAHQSGTGGATLSRSYGGESVQAVTLLFPHWFAPTFATFAERETHLPVDQHQLIALAAPRPVLVTDGDDDFWADPDGAARSVELAAEVYDFLGADARPEQQRRPGGHDVRADDWALAIDWLRDLGWAP